MKGTVSRVLPSKGYGFIKDEEGHMRFVHASSMRRAADFETLVEGDTVEFVPVTVQKEARGNGLRALDVRKVR